MHLGDFAVASIVRGYFNTNKADGTPITLAGTPSLAVYKDGGTTETTSGVTLTVDFDSVTGLHLFEINTGSADYGNGEYVVVIGAGTVDSVSAVGVKVGEFSIGRGVNVQWIGADGQSLTDFKDFVDTGYDPSTHQSGANIRAIGNDTNAATGLMYLTQNRDFFVVSVSPTPTTTAFDIDTVNPPALVGQVFRVIDVDNSNTNFHSRIVTAVADGGSKAAVTVWPPLPEALTPGTKLLMMGAGATAINGSGNVTVQTNNDKAGYALTSGERNSIGSAILTLTDGVETGINLQQFFRACGAVLAGLVSGAGTGTEVFKAIGQGNSTTRVTVTVDAGGNRTGITLNL
jgi:hypothetical protein